MKQHLIKRFRYQMISAITGGMLALASTAVPAVQLNPDGFGEALIYPYYTAQVGADGNAYNSLLSVSNDTDSVKAVKVRIREGRFGAEVKSFNLLLSARDMWTAALVPDGDNLKIVTGDTSCISPAIGVSGLTLSLAGSPADRVREGYIEMIEMGVVTGEAAAAATHVAMGGGAPQTPKDCTQAFDNAARDTTGANTGSLSGNIMLINVLSGISFNAKATALDKFAKAGTALGYTKAGNNKPDLASAESISVVPGEGEDMYLISAWAAGTADAVSAVLMHARVANEFDTGAATSSETNWVLTFPTKPYYYTEGDGGVWKVSKLFRSDFNATDGAPDQYSWFALDREGKDQGGFCAWVCPASVGKAKWASNILTTSAADLNNENLFFSRNNVYFFEDFWRSPIDLGNKNGHLALFWSDSSYNLFNDSSTTVVRIDGSVLKNQTRRYYGLPTIGFSAYNFSNGVIPLPGGKLGRSIYGVAEPHVYKNKIE